MALTPARPSFERALVAGAVLFVAGILTRYDLCFQDPEMLAHALPHAVRHGTGFGLHDFITAFNVSGMDGDSRPRVLSYLAYIVTLKTRLLLWRWLPPHPTLSPMWLLTLVAGPVLFYKFLRIALDDRAAALAGLAVYLVSAGSLSGVVLLFHPAKPLANVLLIAMLYLCARIRRDVPDTGADSRILRIEGRLWIGVLALMLVAPFVDELAVFCAVVPLVWCAGYFWPRDRSPATVRRLARNWGMYFAPVAAVILVLFVVAPAVSNVVAPRRFDFVDYLTRLAQPHRLSPQYLLWQADNLLAPGLFPWRWARTMTPVADGPVLPVVVVGLLGIGLFLLTRAVRAGRAWWRPYRAVALLMAVYVVLLVAAFVFHELDLAATGFYYGAMFSVLFATLVAIAYAALRDRAGAWPARVALVWIVTISAANFFTLDAMWRAHVDNMSVVLLEAIPVPRSTGDWRSLDAMRARRDERMLEPALPPTAVHYLTEADAPPPPAPFADAIAIWRRWREDDARFLDGHVLTTRNLWIAAELSAARR